MGNYRPRRGRLPEGAKTSKAAAKAEPAAATGKAG